MKTFTDEVMEKLSTKRLLNIYRIEKNDYRIMCHRYYEYGDDDGNINIENDLKDRIIYLEKIKNILDTREHVGKSVSNKIKNEFYFLDNSYSISLKKLKEYLKKFDKGFHTKYFERLRRAYNERKNHENKILYDRKIQENGGKINRFNTLV